MTVPNSVHFYNKALVILTISLHTHPMKYVAFFFT